MKTFLFWVEPFPIRDTMIHFKDIINFFNKAIVSNTNKEIKSLIYSNNETIKEIAISHPKLLTNLLIPDEIEQCLYKECKVPWENDGINLWLNLFKESELTERFVEIIIKLHKKYKFDYIVYWGTNFAIQKASKLLKIGAIAMELGCSRIPFLDSVVADPFGNNGDSSISHSDISDFDLINSNNNDIDLLLSNNLNNRFYTERFEYIKDNIFLKIDLNKRIFFLPLQLFDDANLLQYSSFKSIKEILEYILPKLDPENDIIIIKEHPASKFRKGAIYANLEAKTYSMQYENVVYLTDKYTEVNNSQLISLSDCIITVNSSVGFEALYFNKPVVVLGKATYKVNNVFPTLENFLSNNFDINEYINKISKIRNFFLNHYLLNKLDLDNPNFLFNYLEFIGEMNKKILSPKEVISKFSTYKIVHNL